MKYPQLSLRETNAPYMEEMKTAAAEVIEGGWYIRGKYVSRLEEQLCAYLGCRYAVATGNGLDALRLMLRAYIEMGVMQPGDEVIVPMKGDDQEKVPEGAKCYDWFFCTKPLPKEEIGRKLGEKV